MALTLNPPPNPSPSPSPNINPNPKPDPNPNPGPGDPGGGVLPGFRDTDPLLLRRLSPGLRSGAVPYAEAWLRDNGVDVCEEWAVPPPAGVT